MANEFIIPEQIIIGYDAFARAEKILGQFGKKAMIVTSKVMVDLANCLKVENALKKQGVTYTIYLPIAFHDGKNVEARSEMAAAALEAGIAYNNSSVTLIHGMSRPIGALFHIAHGLSNAILLKECLYYAMEGAYDRFADLGRSIGIAAAMDTDKEASEKFLTAVIALTKELKMPTLEQIY